ncbi:MAG: tRNA (N(6)-L-threonylcarbamoyladenosine(37)-C(2))-methylthiotransferase, partial [Nanoarchaeota archaeon]|nr:tRNA (N(6)-L-threonylcarbamoyladenosine(37)-C(2))-methylthiotransferase [Nanoarchaeota archaeon]
MEKGKNTILLDRRREARLNLPKIRKNSVVAIIPVSEGCLGACHYCKVKQARGDLFSYDIPTIAAEIETAVREGIREIWLTSQDMGCYGFDIGTNLVELLRYLTKIKGEFLLRIGMANPNHVLDYLDELIDIYDDPKIFKFLHIPVQSGNDRMLKSMNRKYRVSDFKKIVSRFRKAFPEIAVSTDIICGLPGETLEEFNESVDLIKKTRPDVLNISRFWARPGTVAAGMDGQVHGKVSKIWSQELTKTFHKIALENNQKWISWEGDVIIDEIGRNNTFVGRNYAYKPVIVKGTHRLGDIVKVKIKKVTKFDLSD